MKVTREQLEIMIQNNDDVSNVDTSEITDMSFLFKDNKKFNQNISGWNVSNVINMKSMFQNSVFNNDISNWNFFNVKNMMYIFANSKFNKDIYKFNLNQEVFKRKIFYKSDFNKNIFNFKETIKNKKIYSKHMDFIKNNIVIGEYE